MQERVVNLLQHCNISKEKFNELMLRTGELANDVGTFGRGGSCRAWINR